MRKLPKSRSLPFASFQFVPRYVRAEICNGCGGKGGWFRPIQWWDISKDCDAHDYAYYCGGTSRDRKNADLDLRDAILRRCDSAPFYKRWYYKAQARLYYRAVRLFGGKYFFRRPTPLTLTQAIGLV